jgi:hypothetical protein
MPMTELPAGARDRIAREFAPGDRDAAERWIAGYDPGPSAPPRLWDDVLELARGSPRRLEEALRLARTDWRDLMVAADERRVVRQLAATGGRGPVETRVLDRGGLERVRRDYPRNLARAAEWFPAGRLGEVMEIMGASFPASAEELFSLARGEVERLEALLDGRPAGEVDASIPAPLAGLPLIAAELIRRDFAPERWEAAARAAAGREAHAYDWLLVTEYAGGDPDELSRALWLLREDYRTLSMGVARRRSMMEG